MYFKLLFTLMNAALISKAQDFPPDFKWGVSTSAYQIEGGWNENGKGVSVWDNIVHTNPNFIVDKSSGDVACDSYHKYKEDVQLIKDLGVKYYRFSIAWSRIYPLGFDYLVNKDGIDYYNNLINELIDNGIQPVITLYHWDYPFSYSPLGGWSNEAMIDQFANYARGAFNHFGDRVKMWITFNEPKVVCVDYNYVIANATKYYPAGVIEYHCTHNLLKAHAAAYHIYDNEFRAKQNGQISMTLNFEWSEPNTATPEDQEAAERRRQFEFGWFAHPIIVGDYPKIMKERIANRSLLEGFSQSRLPQFTAAEIQEINGTFDFLGINHYTSWYVRQGPEHPIDRTRPNYYADMGTIRHQDPTWPGSGNPEMKVVPWGMSKLLLWVRATYGDVDLYITECGYPDYGGLDDDLRIDYYKSYISEALSAMQQGVKLKGFFAWSLLDNFEWTMGYTVKFGLYEVNFNDPTRPRKPKRSAEFYKQIATNNKIPPLLRVSNGTNPMEI